MDNPSVDFSGPLSLLTLAGEIFGRQLGQRAAIAYFEAVGSRDAGAVAGALAQILRQDREFPPPSRVREVLAEINTRSTRAELAVDEIVGRVEDSGLARQMHDAAVASAGKANEAIAVEKARRCVLGDPVEAGISKSRYGGGKAAWLLFAGSIVKVDGLPYELLSDTLVSGHHAPGNPEGGTIAGHGSV